ncbi:DUF3516 domain-containing protein, partial [Corynebacterium belfantii]
LMFRMVQLFAAEEEKKLEALTDYLDEQPDFSEALDEYFDEYSDLDVGSDARGREYFLLKKDGRIWSVRQIIKDPNDDRAFSFAATVDLDASDAADEVRFAKFSIDS